MCEPTTIATASLVIGGVGLGLQAYGQYQQGRAANAAAEYNAQVAENNRIATEYQIADTKARGLKAEKQQRLRTKQLIGRQRADIGASGAIVDLGSPADLVAESTFYGEQDALTIRYNTAKEVSALRNQAAGYAGQSSLYSSQVSNPLLAPSGTLLTGTSSLMRDFGKIRSERRRGSGGRTGSTAMGRIG